MVSWFKGLSLFKKVLIISTLVYIILFTIRVLYSDSYMGLNDGIFKYVL